MSAPSALQRRAQARVGALLNEKWRIDALLGIGGMAAVYSATHRNGKRAAIKVLHRELGGDATLVTRFSREGYLANKVGHPGVVSVLDDAVAEDGAPYLVMELLDGYSLEKHTQKTPMAVPSVLIVIDELLDVLASAHACGIVHRDIKPANLFVTREGKLKVLDFGIARLTEANGDAATTQTGAAIGTPSYMPPEQARGRWAEVDARSDLWAVAATMLALVMGQRPRRAETVQEELLLAMTQPMPPASTLCALLPLTVAKVLDAALSFERNDRFPDARAMQLALRRAADSVAAAAGSEGHTLVVSVPTMDSAKVLHPGMAQIQPVPPGAAPEASPKASHQPEALMYTEVTPIPAGPLLAGGSPPTRASGRPMTAPDATVEMAEPHMSSGRTLHRSNGPPGATPARGVLAGVAAGVVVIVLIAGGQLAWTHRRARVAAAPPSAATLPATATATATAKALATEAAPPDPSTAGASAAATPSGSASDDATPSASASAAAAAAAARGRPLRPMATPKAAPSDTASLFDRRF